MAAPTSSPRRAFAAFEQWSCNDCDFDDRDMPAGADILDYFPPNPYGVVLCQWCLSNRSELLPESETAHAGQS